MFILYCNRFYVAFDASKDSHMRGEDVFRAHLFALRGMGDPTGRRQWRFWYCWWGAHAGCGRVLLLPYTVSTLRERKFCGLRCLVFVRSRSFPAKSHILNWLGWRNHQCEIWARVKGVSFDSWQDKSVFFTACEGCNICLYLKKALIWRLQAVLNI